MAWPASEKIKQLEKRVKELERTLMMVSKMGFETKFDTFTIVNISYKTVLLTQSNGLNHIMHEGDTLTLTL